MGLIQQYRLIKQLLFVHYNIFASNNICTDAIKAADPKLQPYENVNNFVKSKGMLRTDTGAPTLGVGNIAARLNNPLTNLDQDLCEKGLDPAMY